ncbi:MAG: DUF3732 domain-containing protein [Caldithrix sp.]|nr:MAG: DUF3732 domain-containing protein [Caldithrix sp.]
MYFQLRKLILWPKSGLEKRVVEFTPGVVNVISGASKTGKSAVIPIIDYCLASGKCAIPVGVIRDACSWFGVVIETAEGQKLLARREPGDQRQTSDMFILEGDEVEVPDKIQNRNATTTIVKAMLDRVAALSNLGFDPESESGFKARPSFRDLMAFTFQPQNIIANPDVFFFKADTTEHREKLKTIFPYVLNAVTAEVLAARWEIARLQKLLRRMESELRAARSTVDVWRTEAHGWLRQAIDLGLLSAETPLPEEWLDILQLLRTVTQSTSRSASPTIASIDASLSRLEELWSEESEAAAELSDNRQRLNEVRRLLQSSVSYGSAIRIQRDRLALSDWLRIRTSENHDALAALSDEGPQHLDILCSALEGIEMQLRSHPTMSDTLGKERVRLSGAAEQSIERLTRVRHEIATLERESEEARKIVYRADQIDRFLGRLEQALKLYDRTDENAELREEIEALNDRISDLRAGVSDQEVQRKTENAIRTIETHASTIIPKLDAEWPNAPIQLVIDDLTIKVVQGTRDDYLWEIGSGANWLAYHVAVTLSLQRFFLADPHHPVPGMLIYDQPSQVYFPRRVVDSDEVEELSELEWRDEDVVAVRKVFQALSDEIEKAEGRLQIIVLDHADADVWGRIDNVKLVENWRKQRLVPEDWL